MCHYVLMVKDTLKLIFSLLLSEFIFLSLGYKDSDIFIPNTAPGGCKAA